MAVLSVVLLSLAPVVASAETAAITCVTVQSATDFAGGVLSGTMVSEVDSSAAAGELRLQAPLNDLFLAPTLDPQWRITQPDTGYTPVITGGILDVQERGDTVYETSAMETYMSWNPGVVLEARAMFNTGSRFIDIGFDSNSITNRQFAWFSSAGTGDLPGLERIAARTRDLDRNTIEVYTDVTYGEWHIFKIIWTPGNVDFYVDGALVASRPDVIFSVPLHAAFFKSSDSGTPYYVDWIRVTPYVGNTGSYESEVLDAGSPGVTWTGLDWLGSAPGGTSLAFATRTGATPAPDGDWSPWAAVGGGGIVSPPGRYAQYQATLATSDLLTSPVIDEVQLCYVDLPDTLGPVVTATIPVDIAVDVAVSAPVRAVFDEVLDPATLTDLSFTLTLPDGPALAAVVSWGADSLTAMLDPVDDLAYGTTYEARLTTAITDTTGNALAADHVWTFTTALPDLTPPTVTAMVPAAGGTAILTGTLVTATFSEALAAATVTAGSFTLSPLSGPAVAATVSWDAGSLTATLDPVDDLAYGTTYEAWLTTAITDAAGNALVQDEVWQFTTHSEPPVCTLTTSTADFAGGVLSGAMISEVDSSGAAGQVRLQARVNDLFLAPTLDPQWRITQPAAGYTPVIVNGVLDVQERNDTIYETSSLETVALFGAGVVCESRAMFLPGSAFVNLGFVTSTTSLGQWAWFSTRGTGNTASPVIKTSVRTAAGIVDILPDHVISFGEWHVFKVVWTLDTVEFWVDGVLENTRTGVTLPLPQRFGLFKSLGSSSPFLVDWVRVTPYVGGAGSYESTVVDAGAPDAVWADLEWMGSLPGGTSLAFETRTGLTPAPDIDWSPWAAVGGGGIVSPPGRYAQYRAMLATTDLSTSPVIDEVQLCYVDLPDTLGPVVTATIPVDIAVDVAVSAPVRAVFDEALDPATLTDLSFTLTLPDGPALAAVVSWDAGSLTATLDPVDDLAYGTTYDARLTTAITDTTGNALAADHAWTFTTALPDLTPPTVTATVPAAGGTAILTGTLVTATFSEALAAATVTPVSFTLSPLSGPVLAAAVGWDAGSLTATLDPVDPLAYGTTYEARLTTAITDAAGNALVQDEVWQFTTRSEPPVCTLTTSTADFAGGVLSGVMISEVDSSATAGQVRLQTQLNDLFLAPTLNPQWWITQPVYGYTPVIVGGVLDVQERNDTIYETSSLETVALFGAGVVCEARAMILPGSAYVNLGFVSSTTSLSQWAWFSTRGTGDSASPVIMTSVRTAAGIVDILPDHVISFGEWHVFKVVWTANTVEFWVDGVLENTRTDVTLPLLQRFGLFKSLNSASPFFVDWVRVTPYVGNTGSYESQVADAGVPDAVWTDLEWMGSLPGGTSLAFETRTGLTPAPDVDWSPWAAVGGGGIVSPPGRFAQYRAMLATSDLLASPVIDEVQLCYVDLPDTLAPVVTAMTPVDGALDVAVLAPVWAVFDEALDPATLTDLSFTLTPLGGSALAAAVSWDAGSLTATLDPADALVYGTTYEARLTTAITDTIGNALAADHVWTFTTRAGSLTDVTPDSPPAVTALLANVPNPFNPLTTVAFDLARPGRVRLRIYAVDGRLIRTLIADEMAAGRHTMVWNGADGEGRGVASGLYLLRLETPGFVQTRKMLMLQ